MNKLTINIVLATILLFAGFGLAFAGQYGNVGCAKIATGTGVVGEPVADFNKCNGSLILDIVFKYYPLSVLFFIGIYYEYKHERFSSSLFIYLLIATLIIIGLLFLLILPDLRHLNSG